MTSLKLLTALAVLFAGSLTIQPVSAMDHMDKKAMEKMDTTLVE